jgi:hypothetical protein
MSHELWSDDTLGFPFPPHICISLQSLAHTLLRIIQTDSGAHAAPQQLPEVMRSGRQGDDTSYN